MPTLRVSKAAGADLENIGKYTQERWGAGKRIEYLDALAAKFETLSQTPTLAAERLDYDPPVRIYHHEKHLIVYAIDDGGILIVRVLHQRMNVSAHLSS